MVAGPAGLKRAGAKLQGVAKQWAVAAVLQRCEALGLPAANGLLWPVIVTTIQRDPTAAMLALAIDVNSIRPADTAPQTEPTPNPIGIAANPIGIQKEGAKHRTLSCVGFTDSPLSEQHLHAVTSNDELSALQGRKSQWKKPTNDRLSVARAAEQRAIDRHARRPSAAPSLPDVRVGVDGLTRVRDEYAHDLSAWDDDCRADGEHCTTA